MEHKVNTFYSLCKNYPILESSASFLLISSTSYPLKRSHHASSTKHSNVANLSDYKLSMSISSSCSRVCLFDRLQNSQTLSKFAMIMNSFSENCVYMNIFSQMEMSTNHMYTTTTVRQVGFHPMVETPSWIHLSITLETSATILFPTHHIALSPTFLGNNEEPLDNYPTTQTL